MRNKMEMEIRYRQEEISVTRKRKEREEKTRRKIMRGMRRRVRGCRITKGRKARK